VERGLSLLQRTGLMKQIFGFERVDDAAVTRTPARVELRLAVFFRSAGQLAVEKLKLSAAETLRVRELYEKRLPAERDDVSLRRWLSKHGVELASDLAVLDAPELATRIASLAKQPLTTKDLALDGAAIMSALQTGPGPAVGKASRFLLDRVLENPALNTPEELRALLAGWTP
jgi:tRNA nucleotidyltransferase (CCA-adding enzyme)